MESENDIMREIHRLAKTKTVILISHRLANVTTSDRIYVMENGAVTESGTQEELLKTGGVYFTLWNAQQSLENYGNQFTTECGNVHEVSPDGHSGGAEGSNNGKDGGRG